MTRKATDSIHLFLIVFCVPLLFFPKVNLLSLQANGAGARLDDLILFTAACVILFVHLAAKMPLRKLELYLLSFLGLSLLAQVINGFLFVEGRVNMSANILYALRPLEYFIFFYVGLCSIRFISVETIALLLFLENTALMLLQKVGWIGGFTIKGYQSNVSSRVIGMTAGPWEVSFLLILILCCFFFLRRSLMWNRFHIPYNFRLLGMRWFGLFGLCGLFLFLMVLTGSRVSMLGFLAVVFGKMVLTEKRGIVRSLAFFGVISLLAGAIVALIFFPDAVMAFRGAKLFSLRNFSLVAEVYQNVDIQDRSLIDAYSLLSIHDIRYDASWFIRIHKWCYVVKYLLHHPECLLLGLGAGFCGSALDGGLLRIIAEQGIIGASVFFLFFYRIASKAQVLKWMVIAFLLNMLFIDIYMSYKCMSFFFFVSGSVIGMKEKSTINPKTALPGTCKVNNTLLEENNS